MTAIYDPFTPTVLADPATSYHHLLEEEPVYWCQDFDPKFYILSRYEDVESALQDIETFSSEFGQGPKYSMPAGMLSDPPQHTFFRRLVQKAFTPQSVELLAPQIENLASNLLKEVDDPRSWDLHDDYAFPLPVIVIANILGVPEQDLQLIKKWSDASVEAMGAEDPSSYQETLQQMAQYLLKQISDRRLKSEKEPTDLISKLVAAKIDDKGLTDEEILGVVNQLLVGGNETTTSLITNAVWRMLEKPKLWQSLVDNPTLVDRAVEESLRFDPPVLGLFRTTTRDVELHGKIIPKNAKVLLHYAAGNRDPRAFNDPNNFSLDERKGRHLAFGLGVHFCLGAPYARLEARVALQALVQHFPNLAFVNSGERIKPFFLWGRKTLPVQVT